MRALKLAALLRGVALVAMSIAAGGARAADLPAAAPAYKAPVILPFSWAGVHIGVHGGYAWGTDTSSFDGLGVSSSIEPKGGFGGGQIGYDTYLIGNWLLGYELDLSGGDINASGPSSLPTGFSATSKTDYFGTARARVGYPFDHWLLYATGGAAWVHNSFDETAISGAGAGLDLFGRNQFYLGWTIGAGVEYALDRNWSVKAEYLYADLGKAQDTVFSFGERTTELTLNMVRLGVNYRFDGSAGGTPVASAYPIKAPPQMIVSPWSGSYVGVQGGFGWGQANVVNGEVPAPPADTSSLAPSGGFGGTESGYNWLFAPNWVFGLASETSYGNLSQNGVSSPYGFAVNTKIDWFGSERTRLGFLATPGVLLYGTGGLAWAHVTFSDTGLSTVMGSFDQYRIGWTGGGGLEWAFTPQWSAKVEYLYSNLGTYQDTFGVAQKTSSLTLNTVKVGLDYHGNILTTLLGWF
jgi:outer membrane immunogenic protein